MKKTVIGMARTWDPLDVTGEVCRQALERLESKEDLRVVTASREITCAEDARAVCLEFESAGVEFAILACCRLVGDGRVVEPFMRSEQELVVWCLPEPTREGPLLLNSMTCANLYMSAAHLLGPECGGKRAWWLYGAPEEALMEARLARILRGRRKALSGTTVVQIGDTAHGIYHMFLIK